MRNREEYISEELQRFKNAYEALKADITSYEGHEEKKENLLKYYKEKIDSLEVAQGNMDSRKAMNMPVHGAKIIS